MAVSSDGVITATVDSTTASILLVIDFTAARLNGANAAAATITVTETTSGRTVRGLTSAPAPGTVAVGIDHEAPFGTTLTYSAHAVNTTGSITFDVTSQPVSITLPNPASGYATWLKSLSSPASSVNLTTKTLPAWSGDIAQGVLHVIGSAFPVVVSDVRGAETATLEVWTRTATQTAALQSLLSASGPYLLQMPGFGEADRYVTVGKYDRPRATNLGAEVNYAWSLPLTSVARPDPLGWRVGIPGHTYADSKAKFPTYSARTGTYESRATG